MAFSALLVAAGVLFRSRGDTGDSAGIAID
jgi:hypothetical protein